MNLAELRTRVDRRSGEAIDAAGLTDFINEALAELSGMRDWSWLAAPDWQFSTVEDQATYGLPWGFTKARFVLIDGNESPQRDVRDMLDALSVWPYAWAIEGRNLLIAPTPQSAMTVRVAYLRTEWTLEHDHDEPLLPEQYQPALVSYACAQVLERSENARSQLHRADFERRVRRMMRADRRAGGPIAARARSDAAF